jgi:hypothetical protein
MKLCGFDVGAAGGRSRGPALRGCDPADGREADEGDA